MLNYVHKDDCKIEVFTPVLKNDAIGLNTLYSFSSGMLNFLGPNLQLKYGIALSLKPFICQDIRILEEL